MQLLHSKNLKINIGDGASRLNLPSLKIAHIDMSNEFVANDILTSSWPNLLPYYNKRSLIIHLEGYANNSCGSRLLAKHAFNPNALTFKIEDEKKFHLSGQFYIRHFKCEAGHGKLQYMKLQLISSGQIKYTEKENVRTPGI